MELEAAGTRRHYAQEEHLYGTGPQVLRDDTPLAGRKHLPGQKSSIDGSAVSVTTTPQRSPTHKLRPHLRSPQNHLQGIAVLLDLGKALSASPPRVREVDSVGVILNSASLQDEELASPSPYIRPGVSPNPRRAALRRSGSADPRFSPPARIPPVGKRPDQAGDIIFPRTRSAPSLSCQGRSPPRSQTCSPEVPELSKEREVSEQAAGPTQAEVISPHHGMANGTSTCPLAPAVSPAPWEKASLTSPIRPALLDRPALLEEISAIRAGLASGAAKSAKRASPRTQAGIRDALADAVGLPRRGAVSGPTPNDSAVVQDCTHVS